MRQCFDFLKWQVQKKSCRFFIICIALGCLLLISGCSLFGGGEKNEYIIPEFPGTSSIVDGKLEIIPNLSGDYIVNPGIGWQNRPELTEFSDFPETIAYSDRREIGWKILNPSEGIYDWAPLQTQLDDAVKNGKQFSFRIYTMVGENYDEHMIPEWVLDKGAMLLENGEPDYSNCVYQEYWTKFVNELVDQYDGNPDIAFIDISGYGNFNEWSWSDIQTEWDDSWSDEYSTSRIGGSIYTIDGQARRRLVDVFIGGENGEHQCRNADNEISELSYEYKGFQETQLVMPYAGIAQSTQYVYSRRKDVGFRYDCLGWKTDNLLDKVSVELFNIWRYAPVVFEMCKPDQVSLDEVKRLTEIAHASVVHDNEWGYSRDELEEVMRLLGYRYFLNKVIVAPGSDEIIVDMFWQNVGRAPSYPKMGQDFKLYVYLLNSNGQIVSSSLIDVDISSWMPPLEEDIVPFTYQASTRIVRTDEMNEDKYLLGVSLMDVRRNEPVNLAFSGRDENGINILGWVEFP